jgi:glycosyltransferase involved in cell wall biosynthesis
MKILYLKLGMHHKNDNALMNYKNIIYYITDNTNILDIIDLNQFDCIYSPCIPIDVSKYPNSKFLFGPHFSVFPEKYSIELIKGMNSIYIQPSDWARDVWRYNSLCNNIRIESLPFGVDTDNFYPTKHITERNNVFIYYKRRQPQELNNLKSFLQNLNINFKIFDYISRYSEEDYINYLKESKFGIWLDAHESQGFALEEALSCDVPLLVWNATTMNQEYGSNYSDIPCTTIPYWDERCGEHFYSVDELHRTFNKFINNLQNYKPREFILENLSIEKCEHKLIELIKKI